MEMTFGFAILSLKRWNKQLGFCLNKNPAFEIWKAGFYLKANKLYYLEGLHKNNEHGSNYRVKRELPGGSQENLIGSSSLAYFEGDITVSESDNDAIAPANFGEGFMDVYPNPAQAGNQATLNFGWYETKTFDRVKVNV